VLHHPHSSLGSAAPTSKTRYGTSAAGRVFY
jgi:hypothetical protein